MVTGESMPVEKGPGDQVIAGTINQAGSLRFRATKVGADTALAQIVRMVETAQNSKAPAQRLADRAAHYLVLMAVGSGVLTFLVWFFVARRAAAPGADLRRHRRRDRLPRRAGAGDADRRDGGHGHGGQARHPVQAGRLARAGVQDPGDHLRQDGTLTEGKPRVTDVVPRASSRGELLRLVGAAEARSGHPLAQAVLDELRAARARQRSASRGVRKPGRARRRGARLAVAQVLVGTRRLLEEQRRRP